MSNVMVMSGKGKVHAGSTRQTLCSRDLGPLAIVTEAEVTCKTCVKNTPAPVVDVRQSDVVLFTGKVRHGAIKHMRDLKRQAAKEAK